MAFPCALATLCLKICIMMITIPLLTALALSSGQVLGSLLGLLATLALVIGGMKYYWRQQQHVYTSAPPATGQSSTLERKYAPFQAQPHALSIRLLSAVAAVALVLVVLAWTPLRQHLYAALDVVSLESEAVEEVPVTTHNPPQSPPPPSEPQVIQLVDVEPLPDPPKPEPKPPTEPGIPDPGPPVTPGGFEAPDLPIFREEPEPRPQEEGPILIAEVMPRFPGCEAIEGNDDMKKTCADKKLVAFIYKNIQYPRQAREISLEGMVVVSFVVGKDGRLSEVELLRDPGAGMGKETLRVMELLKNMPERWTPGKQRGRPVAVRYNLPVRFRLNG